MSFRTVAMVIVGILCLTAVMLAHAANQGGSGVSLVPPAPLEPEAIGIYRKTVEVDVPDGQKLLVYSRVYHNEKLEKVGCHAILSPQTAEGFSKQWPSGSIFDPQRLMPDPTDKIKLATVNFDDAIGSTMWVSAKDKRNPTVKAFETPVLQVGRTMQILKLTVGGATGPEKTPPEWRVSVFVRLETMTDQELARDNADVAKTVVLNAADFPFQLEDDVEPRL
jgi:hypothetical protein